GESSQDGRQEDPIERRIRNRQAHANQINGVTPLLLGLAPLHPGLDEFPVVWRFEIKKCPPRRKVLDESQANYISSGNAQRRRCQRANSSSSYWHAFYHAGQSDSRARGNHCSCETRNERLAPVLGERDVVDLRKTAQHLNLQTADSGQVDDRQ